MKQNRLAVINEDSDEFQNLSTTGASDSTSNDSNSPRLSQRMPGSKNENQNSDRKFNMNGWLTVLGGVCTHLIVGNQYLWGNVNSYVISYFHNMGDHVSNN